MWFGQSEGKESEDESRRRVKGNPNFDLFSMSALSEKYQADMSIRDVFQLDLKGQKFIMAETSR